MNVRLAAVVALCTLPFIAPVQGQGDDAQLLRDMGRAHRATQKLVPAAPVVQPEPTEHAAVVPTEPLTLQGGNPVEMVLATPLLGPALISAGVYFTYRAFKWLKRKLWEEEIRVEQNGGLALLGATVMGSSLGAEGMWAYNRYQTEQNILCDNFWSFSWENEVKAFTEFSVHNFCIITIYCGLIMVSIWGFGCICRKCRCTKIEE